MVKLYETQKERESAAYIKAEQTHIGLKLFLVDKDGKKIESSTIAVIGDSGVLVRPVDVNREAAKKAGISLEADGAIQTI